MIRRVCELSPDGAGLYVASSSSRTLNYKGMLISYQLADFYPDLQDERCASALALVHSRFSTNTFPSWELAHPYRVICHNGEINTVMGNVNWMRARESELASELFGEDLPKILPVVTPGNSDSATFDNVLELLMLAGRSLPHAVMMMIPEAYRDREDLPEELQGLLRLPLLPDGAVGRPGGGRVHRRARGRRDARPQRAAPGALGGDRRRARRARLRDRACSTSRPRRSCGWGGCSPASCSSSIWSAGRIVEDGEVKREVATQQALRRVVRSAARCASPSCEPSEQVTISDQPLHSPPARVRLHPGGSARAARRRWRATAPSRSARWATTSPWRCSPTRRRRCSPTSSSCSPRSPTRRSTRSARKS